MGLEDSTKVGSIRVNIQHHYNPVIACAFAVKDFEYIRKRINANRNICNSHLNNAANRTYESMKTLIDINEVICESGSGAYNVVPDHTIAEVVSGESAQIQTYGMFQFPDGGEVKYDITATFVRHPNANEKYVVTYHFSWDDDAALSGDGGNLSWTDTYPVNPNRSLGYSENFPVPSVIAGRIAENLVAVLNEELVPKENLNV